jgi:hypothetical protein
VIVCWDSEVLPEFDLKIFAGKTESFERTAAHRFVQSHGGI